MRSVHHYCQKCLAGNPLGQELCGRCGTRLMLVVEPPAARYEDSGMMPTHEEHLLERVSALENRHLRLTEKLGGTVVLVTMGTSDATIGIRNALAMGVTSAVHILDDAVAGSDTLGTAKLLAAAIKKQEYDLVICATESGDSYSGIVHGQIAQLLGLPPLTFPVKVCFSAVRSPASVSALNRCQPARCFIDRLIYRSHL
jgi:hypothetical protein